MTKSKKIIFYVLIVAFMASFFAPQKRVEIQPARTAENVSTNNLSQDGWGQSNPNAQDGMNKEAPMGNKKPNTPTQTF